MCVACLFLFDNLFTVFAVAFPVTLSYSSAAMLCTLTPWLVNVYCNIEKKRKMNRAMSENKVLDICDKRNFRSNRAFAQSDQNPHLAQFE